MSNNSTIKFRTKFDKRLQSCSEDLKRKIEEATNTFAKGMSNDQCFDLLWLMTYDPAKALNSFGLEPDSIPEHLVLPWRDELHYQHSLVQKDFFQPAITSENCKAAYQKLLNVSDMIVAAVVYNKCFRLTQYADESYIERTLYLLGSFQEVNYFGGLRTLHFDKSESAMLKPYAAQIHDLLEAIWNDTLLRKASEVNTPLAAPLKRWLQDHSVDTVDTAEQEPDIVVETASATSIPSLPTPKNECNEHSAESSLTVMDIMANESLFEKFLGVCQELEKAGYSARMVVGKLDAISSILEASKMLK